MDWFRARPVGVVVGLGIVFRVAQYLAGRSFWMDEGSLLANVRGKSFASLFGPLDSTQLAPAGFLVVEWCVSRVLGTSPWALRLLPLAAGIASLFLFNALARRSLAAVHGRIAPDTTCRVVSSGARPTDPTDRRWWASLRSTPPYVSSRPGGALIALAMFAVADDLIYYATEFKQYSSDVAIALACGLMGIVLRSGPMTPRRSFGFAAIGATAVWFSHPALFVLATVGLVAFVGAIRRRDLARVATLAAIGCAWLASFGLVYRTSLRQLGHKSDMWHFWAAAFPPSPGSVGGLASWVARSVFYLFVNPLDFSTPAGPLLSALPVVAIFLVGCGSMARRDPVAFASMLLPVGLTLLASCLRLYPFHGRVLLFLVPFLLIPIAEGAAWVGSKDARGFLGPLVVALLLLCPTLDAFYRLIEPRERGDHNPYGDRRPTGLDPDHFPFRVRS